MAKVKVGTRVKVDRAIYAGRREGQEGWVVDNNLFEEINGVPHPYRIAFADTFEEAAELDDADYPHHLVPTVLAADITPVGDAPVWEGVTEPKVGDEVFVLEDDDQNYPGKYIHKVGLLDYLQPSEFARLPYRVRFQNPGTNYWYVKRVAVVTPLASLAVGDTVMVVEDDPILKRGEFVGKVGTVTRTYGEDDSLPVRVQFEADQETPHRTWNVAKVAKVRKRVPPFSAGEKVFHREEAIASADQAYTVIASHEGQLFVRNDAGKFKTFPVEEAASFAEYEERFNRKPVKGEHWRYEDYPSTSGFEILDYDEETNFVIFREWRKGQPIVEETVFRRRFNEGSAARLVPSE